MNRLLIVTLIYSILIAGCLFVFLAINDEQKIDINKGKDSVKQLETFLLMKKEHTADHHEHDEAGYHHDNKFVKMFQDVEQTLNFFVAVLQEENEEFFTSFFLPQQYSDDLWSYYEDPYFNNANYKLMRELNRQGTLKAARYNTSLIDGYRTSREESEVELILIYEDGKEAKLNLNFVLMGSEHSNDDDIYFIKNSVLDLITEVKTQTTQQES
jgi:hypothetical protein